MGVPAATIPHSLLPVPCLEILLQVHSVIERGYLFAVAIEHESAAALRVKRLADAAFDLLGPAGMVDVRIDVGVEAILPGILVVPGSRRNPAEEAHGNDR